MWNKKAIVIFGYFIALLKAQANVFQPITPKISWTNIGIDPPKIVIFFKADFITKNTMTDIWIRLSVPFLSYKLNAVWSSIPAGSCDTSSLVYSPTYEERYDADEIWTTFYVQLIGSTYEPMATYSLKFEPDRYLDFTGFSDSIKIAFVSKNVDGFIVYAYNNAFNCLYGTDQPQQDLILNDATTDANKNKLNKIIDSYVVLQLKGGIAERLLFKASGDYTFADDAEIKCTTVADAKSDIAEIPRADYTCAFFQEIGGSNKNFLAFTWNSGKIPSGTFKFRFTLKTPTFGGSHSLILYSMDRAGSRIHSMASLSSLFKTVPSPWAPDFPKLTYSFGISGLDETLPQGVGLYSTTKGYNVVLNSLVFQLKSFEEIPSISSNDSFSIELQLGSTTAVCPLGSVYHDLNLAPSKDRVIVSLSNGVLRFDNVLVFNGKIYKISLKVGYKDATTLPSDEATGFGFISLIYSGNVIFKSQVVAKKGFTKVYDNKPLLTNRYVETDDGTLNKRHRGLSAFRSAYGLGTTIADYLVKTNRHGLRIGDGQDLVLQTSVGPNSMYYSTVLDAEHDSSKTFFQLVTSTSITSKTSSWADSFKSTNCKMYYPTYAKWDDTLVKADLSTLVNNKYPGITIDVEPTTTPKYDFLGGCSYATVQTAKTRYSRFRWRFQDSAFQYTSVVPAATYYIRGVEVALYNSISLNTVAGAQGTTYVWKNVDIRSFPSQINFGEADSVVLDLYFQVYFFSTEATTDVDLTSTPSISLMENLYVLGAADTEFPTAATFFAPHHMYMDYNGAAPAGTLKLTANVGELWPNVMHVYGNFGLMSDTVFAIKIFFDFVEPITVAPDSREVNCSFKNLDVSKCEFEPGIPDLLLNFYKDVDGSTKQVLTTNSRHAHALIVYLKPPVPLPADTSFSLTFPFRLTITSNTDLLNDLYTQSTSISPSFMLMDNTFTPLTIIDFGASFNYPALAFDPAYYAAVSTKRVPVANVPRLDDATANNNPTDATWVQFGATALAGSTPTAGVSLKSNCQACTAAVSGSTTFGSSMLCGKWDFYNSSSFSVTNQNALNIFKCHKFQYYFQGDLFGFLNSQIYCLYCPGTPGLGASFNLDASASSFSILGFTMPHQNGLKWPAETVGSVGGAVVSGWTELTYLTTRFLPNLITVQTSNIPMKQGKLSTKFQFSVTTTNPLLYGSSIQLKKISGDFLLTVLGKDQKPPCKIRNLIVNIYKCEYLFNLAGVQVNILSDVPAGKLDFELYGVSLTSSATATTATFSVLSFFDQVPSPDAQKDQTAGTDILTITYDPIETSGNLAVSQITSNLWTQGAFADLSFRITLSDRDFLVTDFLSVHLGILSIMEDTTRVRCVVSDLNASLILENVAVCNTESLFNIVIQFAEDTTVKVILVQLFGIQIPYYSTGTGIIATYKFNGDYTAFASPETAYPTFQAYPKFLVNATGYFQLDGRGQRADMLLTITPNSNIDVYKVLYVKFDTQFFPSISMYSFTVYQESNTYLLRSWIAGPGLLAVTGWPFSVEGKLPYTIRIVGVEVPASTTNRTVQVFVADETGLSTIYQWGDLVITEAPSLQGTSLIFVDGLRYDRSIIRINSAVEMDLIFLKTAPRYIYMRIFFDYLSNEIYKTFNPVCRLYKLGSTFNLITQCKAFGGVIEFYLGYDLVAGNTYTLRIEDILNPDYGYCEPIPPRAVLSNAQKTKTVMISSNMVDNFQRVQFVSEVGMRILNYVSIPEGYLEVWRGFYESVEIGPVSTDATERNYFTDKVTFTLSYDLDGLFSSEPINFLGINRFRSDIGGSRAKFIIGANKNTVLTDYILYILRSETYKTQYTDLPLLKVKIISQYSELVTPDSIRVFKGANSLPVYIYPQKIPTVDTSFSISFVETFTDGLSIKDDVFDFTLGIDTPITFITISATSDTTLTSATLKLSKKDSTSLFNDKLIPITIEPVVNSATPNIQISTRDITQFSAKIDFASDQVLYIIFYITPSYDYKAYTKSTVEAWVKTGLQFIGDTIVGYAVINDPLNLVTYSYTSLLAETTYTVRALYSTPLKPTVFTEKIVTFTTLPRNLVNGILSFTFNEPLFMERKIWLLCQICINYAIPTEDLWSDDGLNCERNDVADFVQSWHTKRDGALNETIALLKDKVDKDILTPLKSVNVLIFSSRREYQPSDTFELLFNETRLDNTQVAFQEFINDTATINTMGNAIKLYITNTPQINGNPQYSASGTNVTISGISLSQDGFLLLVYGRKELFAASPTVADIKDVTTYAGFKFEKYSAGSSIELLLTENIEAKVEFGVYMVAFNNDPRKNAKTSTIQSLTFNLTEKASSSWSSLLSLTWAFLVFITIIFA